MKLESYRSYKLTDFKPEMAKIGLLYINMGMEVHRIKFIKNTCIHQLPWKNIYFLFYETLTYFSKCKNLLDNTSWNRIDSRTIVTAWVLSILEPAILAPGTNLKFLKCSNFDKFVFESQLLKIYLRRGLPRLLMDTRLTKDSSVAILFMPSMDAFPALTVLLFDEKL